ncbi:hypothetical protein Tco_0125838 [Tanacetum coccineum]
MAVGRPPLNTSHKLVNHLSPPQPLPIDISALEPIKNRDSAPHNVDGDHRRDRLGVEEKGGKLIQHD